LPITDARRWNKGFQASWSPSAERGRPRKRAGMQANKAIMERSGRSATFRIVIADPLLSGMRCP
jgi:hypothetical protein